MGIEKTIKLKQKFGEIVTSMMKEEITAREAVKRANILIKENWETLFIIAKGQWMNNVFACEKSGQLSEQIYIEFGDTILNSESGITTANGIEKEQQFICDAVAIEEAVFRIWCMFSFEIG